MKLDAEQLIHTFRDQRIITYDDILNYYRFLEPNVKRSTVYWRVHELTKKKILQRLSKGKYQIIKQKIFVPEIPEDVRGKYDLLKNKFPMVGVCLWSSQLINEFAHHLIAKRFLIVEVENDALDSVFLFLKEHNPLTFKNPTPEIMEHYVLNQNDTIIIKKLISEAPLQVIQNVPTITIEKFLVDIYGDKQIFYFLQGNELNYIYQAAFEKYAINSNRMLRYASRRRKKEAILRIIRTIDKS